MIKSAVLDHSMMGINLIFLPLSDADLFSRFFLSSELNSSAVNKIGFHPYPLLKVRFHNYE